MIVLLLVTENRWKKGQIREGISDAIFGEEQATSVDLWWVLVLEIATEHVLCSFFLALGGSHLFQFQQNAKLQISPLLLRSLSCKIHAFCLILELVNSCMLSEIV